MIDPANVTNFNRTSYELEEFLLFSTVVAGKVATVQAKKLDQFLYRAGLVGKTPFRYIQRLVLNGTLLANLKTVKMGQYNRLYRTFSELAERHFDLRTCTVEYLESIHGIGMKTSRFFVMHTRPDVQHACLDVHILKWFSDHLGVPAPKQTPSRKRYVELERLYLDYCNDHGLDPATYDLEIWNSYSKPRNIGQRTLVEA